METLAATRSISTRESDYMIQVKAYKIIVRVRKFTDKEDKEYSFMYITQKNPAYKKSGYIHIKLKDGIFLDDGTIINIKKGFLTNYIDKSGNPVWYIQVTDYEILAVSEKANMDYVRNYSNELDCL